MRGKHLFEKLGDIRANAISIFKERLCSKTVNGFKVAGWHNYFKSGRIGTTGSALPLLFFSEIGEEIPQFEEIIKGLQLSQYKSPPEKLGGWAILSINKWPIVEGTAWPVKALTKIPINFTRETIFLGEKWLIDNQNDDGGWGSDKRNLSRTLLTCLGISSISTITAPQWESVSNAIEWLNKSRRGDYGWGFNANSDSTVYHTALVANTMLDIGIKGNENIIIDSLKYLELNWNPFETNYLRETYDINTVNGYTRIILDHDTNSEVVKLLLRTKPNWSFNQILNAIIGFAEYHENKGFKHPETNIESIWTIIPRAKIANDCLCFFSYLFKGQNNFISTVKFNTHSHKSRSILLLMIFFKNLRNFLIKTRLILFLSILSTIAAFLIVSNLYRNGLLTAKEIALSIIIPIILFILNFLVQKSVKR